MYRHGAIMLFSCTTIVQVLEVLKQVDVANTLTITNDFLGSFFGSWNGLRKTMAYQIGPTVLNLVIWLQLS